MAEYTSEECFRELEGEIISQQQTEDFFNLYIKELELEEYLSLKFTLNAIAPTAINHSSGKKSKIIIQLPIDYTEQRIWGVMHHEIGTHYLRRQNDRAQEWYKNRKNYEMLNSLETEEGLACINQQLENTKKGRNASKNLKIKPYLFRQALYYYNCYMAKEHSFVEIFNNLEKYI